MLANGILDEFIGRTEPIADKTPPGLPEGWESQVSNEDLEELLLENG